MATKKKPTGWNSLTKAQQEAWKKKNFDRSTKVTEAQLNKLRKEGTPAKAIAKYKNDPSMREALNRFYGKDRVGAVSSTAAANKPKGSGPGNTRPKDKRGGPGAKTGKDGRMSSKSGTQYDSRGNTRRPANAGVGPTSKSGSGNTAVGLGAAAAIGGAALYGASKQKPKTKALGPGPIGRAQMNEAAAAKKAAAAKRKAAGIKSRGKYAAPGKTTKRPITRATPGKHAAPKVSKKAAFKAFNAVGKTPVGKVAGKVIGGKVGMAITAGMLAKEAFDSATKKKK